MFIFTLSESDIGERDNGDELCKYSLQKDVLCPFSKSARVNGAPSGGVDMGDGGGKIPAGFRCGIWYGGYR